MSSLAKNWSTWNQRFPVPVSSVKIIVLLLFLAPPWVLPTKKTCLKRTPRALHKEARRWSTCINFSCKGRSSHVAFMYGSMVWWQHAICVILLTAVLTNIQWYIYIISHIHSYIIHNILMCRVRRSGQFPNWWDGKLPKAMTIRRPPLPNCWAWRTWVVCYSGSRTGQTQNMQSEVMAMLEGSKTSQKDLQSESTKNLKIPQNRQRYVFSKKFSNLQYSPTEVICLEAETKVIYQSQWSNRVHKQTFTSRL